MLTAVQLKPYLLHQDPWVRSAVQSALHDSWCRETDLVGLALTAHERYFREGTFPLLGQLHRFPVDAPTVERIMAALAATSSRIAAIQLNWCVAAFPLGLLGEEGGWIETHARVNEEARAQIRLRRQLAGLSDEDLWRHFLEFSGRARMRRPPYRVAVGRVAALTEELAARESPGEDEVCRLLASRAHDGTWFESLLVKVAGARAMKRAVPHIVDKIRGEHDRRDYNTEALVRIGDPAVVGMIRERWPRYSFDSCCDAAGALGGIRTPESEEALLAFFKQEVQPDVRHWIAEALCGLFSREGIGAVLEAIDDDPIDKKALEDLLLGVVDALEVDLPEATPWRDRAERAARETISEELSPQAEETLRKLRECLAGIDAAEEGIEEAYEELGEMFDTEEDD